VKHIFLFCLKPHPMLTLEIYTGNEANYIGKLKMMV